ncbi:hypothetical protein HNR25_005171 [Streptomonospora salina]|uniref:Uncharacterized protein n=1 Tax=Streptomonospora salina TaxID=104205 RepID=A0A841ELZ9_9ACTN|nr:hypothetical protein [Streptomonospora salina]MBB6001340.1 hypothetical protein [Streptomonospora salina]
MDEREMDVRLVGGPADWRGRTVRMPVPADPEEVGAYLISEDTPERPADEDTDPRAVYEPEPGGDPCEWHFRGWMPSSPSDPPPGWYLDPPAGESGGAAHA